MQNKHSLNLTFIIIIREQRSGIPQRALALFPYTIPQSGARKLFVL